MTNQSTINDSSLKLRLDALVAENPDYWSFRGNAKRDHGHGLMQYPAMMVPQMVDACSQRFITPIFSESSRSRPLRWLGYCVDRGNASGV